MCSFINSADNALLLIDHQSGLFQTVKDIDVRQLRINVGTLAKAGKVLSLPTITTASAPDGPNGPLIPELSAAARKRQITRNHHKAAVPASLPPSREARFTKAPVSTRILYRTVPLIVIGKGSEKVPIFIAVVGVSVGLIVHVGLHRS